MNRDSMERALTALARIHAQERGRQFHRSIQITDEISDFSISDKMIRIHPEYLMGADLGVLVMKIFTLEDEFNSVGDKIARESVKDSRRTVERHIRILKRFDPEFHSWILPIIFNSTRKSLCSIPPEPE